MKAIVQDRYGSPEVLELKEIDKPEIKDNEVLVRVHAASVNAADWHFMTGRPYIMRMLPSPFGLRKPKLRVRGRDLSGQVEAVGRNVTRFSAGDEVYGEADDGCFAVYKSVPEDLLGLKPANLTHEQAATAPLAGNTALQGLRDTADVQPGQKVLINGASGGVGTFAVQIAKAFGAEVTGVCSSRNVDLVRSIGADHVIDYTQEDFATSGQRYDVIFDVAGKSSLSDCRRALTAKGTLILCSGVGSRLFGPIGRVLRALVLSRFVSQNLRPLSTKQSKEDLGVLKELIEAGKVIPAIDRTFPLSEVPEALRYFEAEHARAKIVITIQ